MGRKQIINQFTLADKVDSSTVFTLEPTDCSQVDLVTYDVTINGDIVGDSYFQYCNDRILTDDSVWHDLSFGEPLVFDASTEQDYKIEMKVAFKHVRLDWLTASGSGNITVKVYGTTVGA